MRILENIEKIIKYWYAPLVSGIFFIGAGILTLAFTKASVFTLCLFLGVSFLISGVMEIVSATVNRKIIVNWGWTLFLGVIDIMFGVLLLVHPYGTMTVIALFLGLSVMFRSVGVITLSLNMKNTNPKWRYLLVFGVSGIVFAIILLLHPLFAWKTILLFTGITFIAAGIFGILLSLHLRALKERYLKFVRNQMRDSIMIWWRGK